MPLATEADMTQAQTGAQPPGPALSESLEDYLEAIYHIVAAKQAARATDIGRRLKVAGSSVTSALRSLAERGLVNYAPYDIVTLTPEGTAAARKVAHRHEVLQDFFTRVLDVDERTASEAACGMEHHVGRLVLRRLSCLAKFVDRQAERDGGKWREDFLAFCRREEKRDAAASAKVGGAKRRRKAK